MGMIVSALGLLAATVLFGIVVFRFGMEMLARTIAKAIREAPLQGIPPQALYYHDDIYIFDWESGIILMSRDAGQVWQEVSRIERRWFR